MDVVLIGIGDRGNVLVSRLFAVVIVECQYSQCFRLNKMPVTTRWLLVHDIDKVGFL